MRRTILGIGLLCIVPFGHVAAQEPEAPIRRLRQIAIKPGDVVVGLPVAAHGHSGNLGKPIYMLSFTADGKRITSTILGDSDVLLWDLSSSVPTRVVSDLSLMRHLAQEQRRLQVIATALNANVAMTRGKPKLPVVPMPKVPLTLNARIKVGPFTFTSPDGATMLSARATHDYLVMNSLPPARPALPWTVSDAKTGQKRFDLIDPSPGARDLHFQTEILTNPAYTYLINVQVTDPILAWSPTGRHFVWTGWTGNVLLTDAYTGAMLARFPAAESRVIAFSPDGKSIARAGGDGIVRVHEVASGNLRATFTTHGSALASLAFSPDGTLLAAGGLDASVILWNALGRDASDTGADDLAAAWHALSDADPSKVRGAMRTLRRQPVRSIPWLRDAVAQSSTKIRAEVAAVITDLDSSSYTVRQQAEKKLRSYGPMAMKALQTAVREPRSLEAFRRAESLLKQDNGPATSGTWLQMYRAMEVLEGLGAIEPLESFARGDGPIALEARQCWQRLQQRRSSV